MIYRYKRGQCHGYVLNVAEVIDGKENGIVVHAEAEPNTQSDSRVAEEYMEQLLEDGPRQVFIAEGAYNSDVLEKLASEKNVEIQTTSLTGKALEDIMADFLLNEEKTEVEGGGRL